MLIRFILLLIVLSIAACAGGDSAEEQRRLSLRLEHDPPGSVPAEHDAEVVARIKSSLETHRVEAWLRIDEGGETRKIPLHIDENGEARGTIPGRPRGTVIRYALEARDAAGLIVALPRQADRGKMYEVRFEGRSSIILSGLTGIATAMGVLLYLGAGAAAAQHLRGRMSVGPTGLLGGLGVVVLLGGLFLIGGIHAFQVAGTPWPSRPLFLSLSRGDLALVTLVWGIVLYVGREALLEDSPGQAPKGERSLSVAGILTAALLLLLTIF
jgi:hypothetical protein